MKRYKPLFISLQLSVRGKNKKEKLGGFFRIITQSADEVILSTSKVCHHHRFTVRFPIELDFLPTTLPPSGVLMKSIGAFFYDRMPFLT